MPLERDEGEYAYAGQMILQGVAPYKLVYNMKLPGTYAAYALIMAVFGQSPAGIHLGMILVNAATVILMFLLAKRLFGPLAGVAAASSFALLSSSEAVLGFAGHATHFVVLAALSGILVLLRAIEVKRTMLYFLSGLLLGLAFVFKQPGLLFILFGGLYLIVSERPQTRNWRGTFHFAIYSAGAVFPFALTCLIFFLAGELGRMWFWTFSYARQYASVTDLWDGWQNLFVIGFSVVEPYFLVWILAALGLAALAWDSRVWKHALFTIGFLLFSWGAVCAGFYFRPHYFILVLPAVSLLVGITLSSATHELSRLTQNPALAAIPGLVFLVVLVVSVAGESDMLFRLDPVTACRHTYGNSPFPEAQTVSEYLNRHTSKDARVAVLGSEPEIYFYSKRHSATGYIYTYPLVEPQPYALEMQKAMAKEIEENHPEYIVLVKIVTSWQARPNSHRFILEWFQSYAEAHYQIVGIADEVGSQTQYVWGDAAKSYHDKPDAAIEIFKRNPG